MATASVGYLSVFSLPSSGFPIERSSALTPVHSSSLEKVPLLIIIGLIKESSLHPNLTSMRSVG